MSLNDSNKIFPKGYCPPRLPTTCLSMPPRFDRDLPNNMLSTNQLLSNVIPNGMMCNPNQNGVSNGMNTGNNNQILNGLNNQNTNGMGNVAASLRKPLLELNGSILIYEKYIYNIKY